MSLLDIARCAGVSVSTVSRALLNRHQIPQATRERIRRLACEMGYTPDPLAAVLAKNRWQTPAGFGGTTLAFVHCTRESEVPMGLNGPLPGLAAAAARERGYRLDCFNLAQYSSGHALSRVLRHRGIRGLLIAPVYCNEPPMHLDWEHFSAVSLGPGFFPLPLHRVYFNAYDHIDFAIRKAWSVGYRRVGLALMRHPMSVEDDDKRAGAVAVHQSLARERSGQVCQITFPAIYSQKDYLVHASRLHQWFNQKRPDVVIGFNGMVYQALRETNTGRCPEDYAFVNLYLDDEYSFCAGILPAGEATIRLSVDVLDSLLRNNEVGLPANRFHFNVDVSWRDGVTLREKTAAELRNDNERLPASA